MREAVIVSTARTPIGKAYRGAFNNTSGQALGAHAIKHAVERAKVDPGEVEDVVMGAALQMGSSAFNTARQCLLEAGLPDSVAGQTIDRQCSSGMMAISIAAKQIISDGMDVAIGGGVESISTNQTGDMFTTPSSWLLKNQPALYMAMIETAEVVGERYGVSREDQDVYSAQSQARTAAAQQAGAFDEEIVPLPSVMKLMNKETGEASDVDINLDKDEHPRFGLKLSDLEKLKTVFKEKGTVTAGNSSGINDGAAALLLTNLEEAEKKSIKPLAKIVSWASVGVDPSLMGLGPIKAVKKAVNKAKWNLEDVDLFEINEAFAAQSIAVIQELKINKKKVNVNGGAISLGHPIGASGARILVTLLHEMIKQNKNKGCATLCIGGGMGIALCVEKI